MQSAEFEDAPATSVRQRWFERLAAALAVIGGALITFAALLVTVSVLGRWLLRQPVPADYELVEVCVGVAVFAFLAYTQARSGHIAVDTFTLKVPPRINAVIDGIWDFVLAGFLGFFSWGLFTGGMNARAYGETLIQLPWPIWPVYVACSILAGLACVIALSVAFLKIGGTK